MSRNDQRKGMNNTNGVVSELQLGKRKYENKEDANDILALRLASFSSYSNRKPSLDSPSSSTHLSKQEITQSYDHGIPISSPPPSPTQMMMTQPLENGFVVPPPPPPSKMMTTQPHGHGILIPPLRPNQMTMNSLFPFNLRLPVSEPTFGYNCNDNSTTSTNTNHHHQPAGPSQRAPRAQRSPARTREEGTSDTVPVLYPWATDKLARVHSLEYLRSKQIETISGLVHCKKCEKKYEIGFNLEEKFAEIYNFIARHKSSMHDRAPTVWLNPVFPRCKCCHLENGVRPVMAENNKEINWLFLLLGQMLGFLTLEQLKYFCKHTKNHRTGAKDRVLYLTYLELCKQLDPNGPFDR